MSPILGIYASQITGHLFTPSNSYTSIATATVDSGGASSITFSSIPSTYTHLQIREISRGAAVQTSTNIQMQFNSDTGTNYSDTWLYGNGTSAVSNRRKSRIKSLSKYL